MNSLSLPLALGLPGGSEWILILVVILVLFGGKKIPELMRGVGKGMGELQKGLDEGKKGFSSMIDHDDTTTTAATAAPVTPTVTPSSTTTTPPTA